MNQRIFFKNILLFLKQSTKEVGLGPNMVFALSCCLAFELFCFLDLNL